MTTGGSGNASLNDLIQGLQQDLAREYKSVITDVIFSQKIDQSQNMDIATKLEEHAHQELDHAIQLSRQLDYFGAYPTHQPAEVNVSEDNDSMLRIDLDAEDAVVKAYDERIRQAQALGEWALAEVLQDILKDEQDHQIDLATALGEAGSQKIRAQRKPAQAGTRR